MTDGETLTLSREGIAQGHETSCPGKRGLEVRRDGMRAVTGWGSEASWDPGSWAGERNRTTWYKGNKCRVIDYSAFRCRKDILN